MLENRGEGSSHGSARRIHASRTERVADPAPPPFVLQRADSPRGGARECERFRLPQGALEPGLESIRLGIDAFSTRETSVGFADGLAHREERTGGVEKHRANQPRGRTSGGRGRDHSSTGTCQNWMSTPKSDFGWRKAVLRSRAKSNRSTTCTPARSKGSSAASRSSTSIDKWCIPGPRRARKRERKPAGRAASISSKR